MTILLMVFKKQKKKAYMNKNFHDLIILKIFSNKNGNLNSGRIKKIPNYKNISNYLNNRFEFISSYTEALNNY